jgi:hypothetical protein
MNYVEIGHKTYGTKCEWVGCGWDAAQTDVHHINYQQHQAEEDEARGSKGEHFQLPKDNNSTNLAVLCPNHHRFVHARDLGMDILKYIPIRK